MDVNDFKILLVDDETDVLDFMKYNLEKEGFWVYTAGNGVEAIQMAKKMNPHLIILDLMMPKMDGIETCRELRNMPEFKNTIITFLTARDEDYSQIAGFEVGADDYITKPIKPRVFISRIRALLRRLETTETSGKIIAGDIEIDRERYVVVKAGKEISLPRKEFELLNLLVGKPGRVFKVHAKKNTPLWLKPDLFWPLPCLCLHSLQGVCNTPLQIQNTHRCMVGGCLG